MTGANDKRILLTGIAGFIGFHFAKILLKEGFHVIGIDNLNSYYDVNLKLDRLKELGIEPDGSTARPNLVFYRADLKEKETVKKIFEAEKPGIVVHLAAQAGVRYSLVNPDAYIDSNILGFMNILENCRHQNIKHLVFASSSSIYGANKEMPFSEHHNVDHPISLYAATKKSNELMAHAYSYLYRIPCTGLRFFTVYGPWGRPDMAYFSFTYNIMNNIPVEVFNYGNMKRDFTYIDDITEGVYRVMLKVPVGSPAPFRIFNIGNNRPIDLTYFIELLEKNLGKKAEKKLLPLQEGDVKETYADIDALHEYIDFKPVTPIEEGIARFVKWYLNYYR